MCVCVQLLLSYGVCCVLGMKALKNSSGLNAKSKMHILSPVIDIII